MTYIKKGFDRSQEHFKKMVKTRRERNNYNAWNKGLKLGSHEEQFGKKKAKEISEKHTESAKRFYKEHPEAREKISSQLRNRKITEKQLVNLRRNIKEISKLRTTESFKKQADKIRGRKNIKCSETRKRLFKEGRIKAWNKGIKINRNKYPNFGRFGKRDEEERLRLKQLRINQVFPLRDTSIEVKIQNFLKELKIGFFIHVYMKEIENAYQCDIFIPVQRNKDRFISKPIIIECDGDYWHKLSGRLDRDKLRTSELKDKGFKVLRLWESEINKMDVNRLNEKLGLNERC